MSKVVLTDGKELTPMSITGAKQYIQGQNRDTLTFVFPASEGLENIDEYFTEVNCENIKIIEDETEYIHSGYVIRAELNKSPIEIKAATDTDPAEYEERITISMSQRTYAESQIASLTDTVDVLVMESLMGE